VYGVRERDKWLAQIQNPGARVQAELLYEQLDVLNALRERAKAALVAEARRDRAWAALKSIPYMGPVRIALVLAIMKTPLRFRSKRHLWGYAGFAVVTHSSGEHDILDGRVVRRHRKPLTRGLNRNHNPVMKAVFKGAANSAAARPGPLQDVYRDMLARGMRAEMARVTLARKLAAVTLHIWKTGETFDPAKLTAQAK
jgi:transposase